MNIKLLHPLEKTVSATPLFKGEGNNTVIRILAGQTLKEHSSKVAALLLCVEGELLYEDEDGEKTTLLPGDFINIEPMVKHWLYAISDCHCLLLK